MSEEITQPDGAIVEVIDGEVRSTNPSFGAGGEITPEIGNDALGVIIPTVKGRRTAYAVYVAISALAGASMNICAVINTPAPEWLLATVSTVAYLGSAFGITAIANLKGK